MTDEQIVENNFLIARFMGGEYTTGDAILYLPRFGLRRFDTIKGNKGIIIRYHESWDWLMTAVDKINNLEDKCGEFYDFHIGNGYVWVDPYIGDRIYFSGNDIGHGEEPMINKAYRGVITFIKHKTAEQ